MPTIPSYPPPANALADTDLVVGYAGGKTVRISAANLLEYIIAGMTPQLAELLFAAIAEQVDINGGEPPAAAGIYIDGGTIKVKGATS